MLQNLHSLTRMLLMYLRTLYCINTGITDVSMLPDLKFLISDNPDHIMYR
jgi:hypothetical protein